MLKTLTDQIRGFDFYIIGIFFTTVFKPNVISVILKKNNHYNYTKRFFVITVVAIANGAGIFINVRSSFVKLR